jgi:hypothetical protein
MIEPLPDRHHGRRNSEHGGDEGQCEREFENSGGTGHEGRGVRHLYGDQDDEYEIGESGADHESTSGHRVIDMYLTEAATKNARERRPHSQNEYCGREAQ